MSLVKLAIENDPIKKQHKLAKGVSGTAGAVLGSFYGGALASRKSKKLTQAQHALTTAQTGHIKTQNPSFIKKIFGAKPKHIKVVDNQRVGQLSKVVSRLKKVHKVKMGLGAAVGAAILGTGMAKMQDVQNNYEVALLKLKGNK